VAEPFDLGKAIENFALSLRQRGRFTHSYFVITSTAIIQNELQKLIVKAMRPLSKSVSNPAAWSIVMEACDKGGRLRERFASLGGWGDEWCSRECR